MECWSANRGDRAPVLTTDGRTNDVECTIGGSDRIGRGDRRGRARRGLLIRRHPPGGTGGRDRRCAAGGGRSCAEPARRGVTSAPAAFSYGLRGCSGRRDRQYTGDREGRPSRIGEPTPGGLGAGSDSVP